MGSRPGSSPRSAARGDGRPLAGVVGWAVGRLAQGSSVLVLGMRWDVGVGGPSFGAVRGHSGLLAAVAGSRVSGRRPGSDRETAVSIWRVIRVLRGPERLTSRCRPTAAHVVVPRYSAQRGPRRLSESLASKDHMPTLVLP